METKSKVNDEEIIKVYHNEDGKIIGKLVQRSNGSRRLVNFYNHGSKTSQEDLKASDINNIMSYYKKTNVLPQTKNAIAQYLDVSEIPTLEEAHQIMTDATMLFNQLPASVRKLVDNDATKLDSLLRDEKYTDFLIKEGVLDKVAVKQEVSQDPPPAGNDSVSESTT